LALVLAVVVSVALVSMALVVPSMSPGHSSRSSTSAPIAPAEVDPQFLPAILTSPNSTSGGEFGAAVAASGSTVAVGAPHEEYYAGYVYYGAVHLQNMATGATGTLRGPGPGGGAADFGASVAMTSTLIVVGAPGFEGNEGSAYVYNYTTAVEGNQSVIVTKPVASLLSPDASSYGVGGHFGYSVAISGNLVVVGAPYENASGAYQAGHAYIYNTRTGVTVMLSSPVPQLAGDFGWSVAISGNRVIVGAPDEENSTLADVGHVYEYAATTGDLVTTLTSPSPASGGSFGRAVAINGTTVVVGQPFGVSVADGVVFEFNLVSLTNQTFVSPAPVVDGYFGLTVAVDSNMIVVGAPGEESGGSSAAGNAYLFSIASGSLITSTFVAPDWPAGGYFGLSVAENGGNGVLVGAPYESAGGYNDAGHAYYFTQIPLTVSSPNPVQPTEFSQGGQFGYSVSVDGAIVIGAPNENGSGVPGAGNAYLLRSHAGPLVPLTNPNPEDGGGFGTSVSIWGNLIVVGAPEEETTGADDGSAYVYNATTGALITTLGSPDPASYGFFGAAVATNGSAIVVGAPGEANDSGSAYVFAVVSHAWRYTQLSTPNPFYGVGGFGDSVAISGSTVVVGAWGENSTSGSGTVVEAGNAYVFNADSGALLHTLTSTHPGTGGEFGSTVAISGNTIVVGAHRETVSTTPAAGYAYVFSASTGALLYSLTSTNPQYPGWFGYSVSVNDGIVVVGASLETAFGVGLAGNVYLFNAATGAPIDRYNNPIPSATVGFAASVSIGPVGAIAVGATGGLLSSTTPGQVYEFFF
jgi:hypothetical protein